MDEQPTVFLVEDDSEMRESLQWMLQSEGLAVAAYSSPAELLERYDPDSPGCLVLDLRLPGMSGLELYRELAARGGRHPFLMITGHGTIPNAVEAMRDGAVDFIPKPFGRMALLERVWEALAKDATERKRRAAERDVLSRLQTLTRREREVLELVVAGRLTKQIARQLGISTKTVEVHRSKITRKMQVDSVAQLVQAVTLHRSPPAR